MDGKAQGTTLGGKVHRESAARRRFGKIAEVKRGASEARRRGEEREQKAEEIMQDAAFLLRHLGVWHDPPPRAPPQGLPGVLACRPGRGFRGPYRQSEMSQAEAHYL